MCRLSKHLGKYKGSESLEQVVKMFLYESGELSSEVYYLVFH